MNIFKIGIKYFSPSEKLQLVVPTTLYQLPVFLRGGSVITLYKASTSNPPQSMQVEMYVNGISRNRKFHEIPHLDPYIPPFT